MKLYKVKLIGVFGGTSTNYNESYVIANDSEEAYKKVRSFLDRNDIGFKDQRELNSVQLLAEDKQYPECKTILFAGDKPE
jgi:hypothetical protein